MTRSAKNRTFPRKDTAERRLRSFLDRHPDALSRLTLSDVAREIGVSRQTTHKLLPRWTKRREALQRTQVRSFARRHPAARLSDPTRRISWSTIAAETALPVPTVQRIWISSGLPFEDRLDPAVFKLRRAERQRRRLATVLRQETCEVCGARFPWTIHHERARKYVGRWTTCSRSCTQRLRHGRPATS